MNLFYSTSFSIATNILKKAGFPEALNLKLGNILYRLTF